MDEGEPAELFSYRGPVAELTDPTNQPDSNEVLNLKQVAATLGVHYMTAYRYVRTGQLPAERGLYGWEIRVDDLAAFTSGESDETSASTTTNLPVDWVKQLCEPLCEGDEVEAWRVIERALASSYTPQECLADLIPQALSAVPTHEDAVEPFLAFAVTRRIVARLGARFRRPGRSRGIVIVGSPEGEAHEVPVTILADLIRLEGFTCIELGANIPAPVFVAALRQVVDHDPTKLLGVAVSVSWAGHAAAVTDTVNTIREASSDLPILIGGQGVLNPEIAAILGANLWAADLHDIAARLNELTQLQPAGGYTIDSSSVAEPLSTRTLPTGQESAAIRLSQIKPS